MAKTKYPKKLYSEDQKNWCSRYEADTGFEPLMDEYEAGNESFVDGAKRSLGWFSDWAEETHRKLENVPGAEAQFMRDLGLTANGQPLETQLPPA